MKDGIYRLFLKNFRSYCLCEIYFNSNIVAFCGDNGAGKTNLLEAISLFSTNRGLRKADISSLHNINIADNAEFIIQTDICVNSLMNYLVIQCDGSKKTGKIDSCPISTFRKFEELVWITAITPDMSTIFLNSPSIRRNFFDELANCVNSSHTFIVKHYNNLIKERMQVLLYKNDKIWLKILEEKIAHCSIKITKTRIAFLEKLHDIFLKHNSSFLIPKIFLQCDIFNLMRDNNVEIAEQKILEQFYINRKFDFEKQVTCFGVHKAKYLVKKKKDNIDVENCSTGQQKAFLISIIIGCIKLHSSQQSGLSVLLLDDLMTTLDEHAKKDLVSELRQLDAQIFLTGTNNELFDHFGSDIQMFSIKNSICSQENSA